MNFFKKLCFLLLLFLIKTVSNAQSYPTCDVVLIGQNEKTITINASKSSSKKKYLGNAIKWAAFNTLFKIGIAGYNNGKPLVDANSFQKNREYFDDFMLKQRCNIFIKSERMIGEISKVGREYKGTMQIEIYINTLLNDLKSNVGISVKEEEKPKDLEQIAEEIQMPTIMVVPYKRSGESYQKILQDDFDRRIAVATVQEGFNQKGVTTIDFEAKLNAALRSANFEMNDAQTIDKQLIRNSGSDVYVSVDIQKDFGYSGNRVSIILKAYETATGNVLANKQNWSPRFRTTQMDKLSSLAIKYVLGDFLDQVSKRFSKKATNGNTIVLNVSIANDSMTDMDSEVGNDQLPLSDLLRLWVKKNAFKGRYHVQGSVSEAVIFDQIKVPTQDQNGNPYSVSDFAFNLWDYLRSDVGLACKKRVDGNTIYITILE